MPKVSAKTAANVADFGAAIDRNETLDDTAVSFVEIKQTHDLGAMLAGLPGGHCSCPHWGYMFKGRLTVQYADHEEVFEAGDAFYMTPGHVPAAEAGSEFVQFSPAKEMAETEAAIRAFMQSQAQS